MAKVFLVKYPERNHFVSNLQKELLNLDFGLKLCPWAVSILLFFQWNCASNFKYTKTIRTAWFPKRWDFEETARGENGHVSQSKSHSPITRHLQSTCCVGRIYTQKIVRKDTQKIRCSQQWFLFKYESILAMPAMHLQWNPWLEFMFVNLNPFVGDDPIWTCLYVSAG